MNEPKEYYSTEEVAELLDLHVRTIRRFIREGKLRATRIGKQFRIAESDFRKLAGSDEVAEQPRSQKRRRIVVSTTVDVDAIGQAAQERLVNLLGGAFHALDGEPNSRRFDAIYYEDEGRLRLLINADLGTTNTVLGMLRIALENIENTGND
jgi:excisionase family DNA binding protein